VHTPSTLLLSSVQSITTIEATAADQLCWPNSRAAVYSLVNVPNCYMRLLRLADSLDCTSQRSTAARTA